MSVLVDDLKNEHSIISETLEKVKNLGIATKEGQEALLAGKSLLLAHLKKEDEQLYPHLNREAEKNPGLRQTLDSFTKDTDSISKSAMDFFEKYSGDNSGLEFARDFGRLIAGLSQRIVQEENIIYAEYDRLRPPRCF